MFIRLGIFGFFKIIFPLSVTKTPPPLSFSFICPFRIFNFNCFGSRGRYCKSCGAVIIRMWHIYTQRVYKKRRPSARLLFNVGPAAILWDIFLNHSYLKPACKGKKPFYRTLSCKIKYYYSIRICSITSWLVHYILTLVSVVIELM